MEKLLLSILLPLLPLVVELAIDGYRVIKLNRRDNHGVTGSIRVALMILCGLANPTVAPWQTILLCFSVHWLFFDYAMNLYVLDKRLGYLGNNFFDRIFKRLPSNAVLGFKVMMFATGVKFYINPSIY